MLTCLLAYLVYFAYIVYIAYIAYIVYIAYLPSIFFVKILTAFKNFTYLCREQF